MLAYPRSFGFFFATVVVFMLQLLPPIGIFLMILGAAVWSVVLINAGMIGTVVEAVRGQVSRSWLILPGAFYGSYFGALAVDYATLYHLRAQYDAANEAVAVAFDPERQSLVVDREQDGIDWLFHHYRLPVIYETNPNVPEGFLATRMIDRTACKAISGRPSRSDIGIHTFSFQDGETFDRQTWETRFCDVRMPESPTSPLLKVTAHQEKAYHGVLPITRITTTIITPDGKRFRLLGGYAAPFRWFPMPVLGCALNSGDPRWECDASFLRQRFTPIISGDTRFNRDSAALARALGLTRVTIAERRGADIAPVQARIAKFEGAWLNL